MMELLQFLHFHLFNTKYLSKRNLFLQKLLSTLITILLYARHLLCAHTYILQASNSFIHSNKYKLNFQVSNVFHMQTTYY